MRSLLDQGGGRKVQTIVTSPPYWNLRDYGVSGQIGMEPTLQEFIATMVDVFDLARELLADDGTLWLNLGDSYSSSGGGLTTQSGVQFAGRRRAQEIICLSNRTAKTGGQVKDKELCGVPWRVAFALSDAGWYLRQDIIWAKKNCMPESVRDRCTKSHEYLFLLTKRPIYFFDQDAIKEPASPDTHARYARGRSGNHKHADGGPGGQSIAASFDHMLPPRPHGWASNAGAHNTIEHNKPSTRKVYPGNGVGFGHGTDGEKRGRGRVKNNASFDAAKAVMPETRNKRSVWTIATQSYSEAHFATFPEALVEPCILAGSRPGDIVFDPFMGSGTVAQVAQRLGRKWLGSELNPEYIDLQGDRTRQAGLEFAT
jgi:DNA modification methylase